MLLRLEQPNQEIIFNIYKLIFNEMSVQLSPKFQSVYIQYFCSFKQY